MEYPSYIILFSIKFNILYFLLQARKEKISSEHVSQINTDVIRLLKSKDVEEFNRKRDAIFLEESWNTDGGNKLKTYFNQYVDRDMKEFAISGHLEAIGLPNPERGITNNPSETYNSQISKLRPEGNKEESADHTITKLYSFECQFHKQITASYYQAGLFKVKEEYRHLEKQPAELPSLFVPSNETLRKQIAEITNPIPSALMETPVKSEKEKAKDKEIRLLRQRTLPLITDDWRIKKVEMHPGNVHYAVVDTNDVIYTVKLDNNSCSCRSKVLCSHMFGTLIASGYQSDLSIPKGYKIGDPTTVDKPNKGRADKHGTKTPIAKDLIHSGIKRTPLHVKQRTGPIYTGGRKLDFNTPTADDKTKKLDSDDDLMMDYLSTSPTKKTPDRTPLKTTEKTPDFTQLMTTEEKKARKRIIIDSSDDDVIQKTPEKTTPLKTPKKTPKKTPNKTPLKSPIFLKRNVRFAQNIDLNTTPALASPASPLMTTSKKTITNDDFDEDKPLTIQKTHSILKRTSSDKGKDVKDVSPISTPPKMDHEEDFLKNLNLKKKDNSNMQDVSKETVILPKLVATPDIKTTEKNKSVNFTIQLDAHTITEDTKEKDLRLKTGDFRLVNLNGTTYALKSTINEKVIIFANEPHHINDDIISYGASAVSSHATRDNKHSFHVQVATKITKTELHLAVNQVELIKDVNYKRYEITCPCGRLVMDSHAYSKCTSCSKKYHNSCPDNNKDGLKDWKCKPCDINIKGVPWAKGKYTFTCPIDGHLTLTALHVNDHPKDEFLDIHFNKKRSSAQKDFRSCIEMVQKEQYGEAQDLWGDRLHKNKYAHFDNDRSLQGSMHERNIDPIRDTCVFKERTTCTSQACRRPRKVIVSYYHKPFVLFRNFNFENFIQTFSNIN